MRAELVKEGVKISSRMEMKRSLSFLRLHPSTAFQTLVDLDGYSISSKGFLPTVVDIIAI